MKWQIYVLPIILVFYGLGLIISSYLLLLLDLQWFLDIPLLEMHNYEQESFRMISYVGYIHIPKPTFHLL